MVENTKLLAILDCHAEHFRLAARNLSLKHVCRHVANCLLRETASAALYLPCGCSSQRAMSMKTMAERIASVKPALLEMVSSLENGTNAEGAEACNVKVMDLLQNAGLVSIETRSIDHVGVHPENREGCMLVPSDVHDLLKHLSVRGWNPAVWSALACTIPEGAVGEAWRQANMKLVAESEGMLAPVSKDGLQLLTGRGSHGTAALRAVKFAAKAVHDEMAGPSGEVSRHKLLEKQPSLQQPLESGCVYSIIPGELCIEVPGLFSCISRLGNASSDSFRLPTTLQHCSNIHKIATGMADNLDWSKVARIAALTGMTEETATKLCRFVQAWSGGKGANTLRELELYEKGLKTSRKLMEDDMVALSKLDLVGAPTYVPAAQINKNVFSFARISYASMLVLKLCACLLSHVHVCSHVLLYLRPW